MVTIEDAISTVYNNKEHGFGSIRTTLKFAKQLNEDVTYNDVKLWKEKNIARKTQLPGYNSYGFKRPYEEYQMDLFFFADLDKELGEKQPYALLMVDPFSKFCKVVPTDTKQPDDILNAIKECMKRMEAKPETVCSDEEGAFVSNKVQKYFKDEEIRHLVTRNHAYFAERTIKTIKNMVYKRVEASGDKKWTNHIKDVLNMYNKIMVHSSTGRTPYEGRIAKFRAEIKARLDSLRHHDRIYPSVHKSDQVKVFRKKDKLDKENVSTWSKNSYEVTDIIESKGQTLYKTTARDRPFIRSEILALES